jgi:hypothetical protein
MLWQATVATAADSSEKPVALALAFLLWGHWQWWQCANSNLGM